MALEELDKDEGKEEGKVEEKVQEEGRGEGGMVRFGDEKLRRMCAEYSGYPRVSLAEDHGQIVTLIANLEEQLHGFQQLLEVISSDSGSVGGAGGLVVAQRQWTVLQPSLARLERLEALVARVAADMEVLEAQMDEAEATVGGGPLKQVSEVLRNPLSLFRPAASPPPPLPAFHPAEIFRTQDFFP